MLRPTVLLAALFALAAAAPSSAQTYYDHVRPVLVENCMNCHSEAGVAWSMEDAETAYERARRIARAIDQRRMPPFLAERGHQQYVGDITLDDRTVMMVRRWAEAGYPKGDPKPDPQPHMSMPAHGSFAADVTLPILPEEGYLPNQESSDDYRCFLADWSEDVDAYVTGFQADPGNRNVGHHVVVYAVEPDMWSHYRDLEDIEDGPGYTCFGGALPDELVRDRARIEAYEADHDHTIRELSDAGRWLAHWAPGMDGHVFPEGTGLQLEPGSGLVVQMHYYAGAAPGERDRGTRMGFTTASQVERPAMHLAQTDNDWFAAPDRAELLVEPGEIKTYEYRNDLEDIVGYVAGMAGVPADDVTALEIHSANLHMHAIGHSGEITLTHPTGEVEVLLRVPRWDLGWQRDFTFVEPKVLSVDDLEGASLAVRCTFENTTDETVYGGPGSGDEMCFNFSYISVVTDDAVTTPQDEARQR